MFNVKLFYNNLAAVLSSKLGIHPTQHNIIISTAAKILSIHFDQILPPRPD